ncbi:copper homeostasis protein CutC [Rhizobium sp. LjRoot30]|uniref:copper homeostasis protein CutC n=1 Tax=Rhizobium sp. LjRoot30 TaxID=3342320 RepID=UPI003ED03F43
MADILLEVCVDSAAGLEAAVSGGADRIELCSALALGGLTPTLGLMHQAARVPIPVYAMIRPRAGDFIYSPVEVEMMKVEIEAVRHAGLAGVVIGANRPDGRLDHAVLKALVTAAEGLGSTLHRSFDLVPDIAEAVDVAVDVGFERILSAGGARTVAEGMEGLQAAIAAARGRVSIMPGAGVTLATIDALLSWPAVTEVHSSCSRVVCASGGKLLAFGFESPEARSTEAAMVAALKQRLRGN